MWSGTSRACSSSDAPLIPRSSHPRAARPTKPQPWPLGQVPLIELADGLDPVWQLGSWYLDTSLQPGVEAMCTALRTQGVPFEYHREAGGRHNARAWGSRVERPLRVLLPPGGRHGVFECAAEQNSATRMA